MSIAIDGKKKERKEKQPFMPRQVEKVIRREAGNETDSLLFLVAQTVKTHKHRSKLYDLTVKPGLTYLIQGTYYL